MPSISSASCEGLANCASARGMPLAAEGGPGSTAVVNQMQITDNVFQLGASTKCATYGPVAGWDEPNQNPGTSGYRNVWSGNTWNNGAALQAP